MVLRMVLELLLSTLHLQSSSVRTAFTVALTTPEQAKKLDPALLKAAFDREDLSDAVSQVELGWKFQYEGYYQGKLTSQYLSLEQIQQRLFQLQKLTGKSTALIYAVPGQTQLDILVVPPKGKPVHRRITAADRENLTKTIQTFRIGVVNPESQSEDYASGPAAIPVVNCPDRAGFTQT
jgi:CHAT domain-containing protein